MDENEVVTQEVEEQVEEIESSITEEEISEMWDEDESDIPEYDGDESADESAGADQPEAETSDGNPEPEAEENTEAEDADQYLELKHFDEVKKVGKEEAKVLAQKGMDYDRIRGKLDEAEKDNAKLKEYEKFLGELKGDFDTVEDLIDDTRARIMADKEHISHEDALAKVKENRTAETTAEVKQPEPDPDEFRKRSFALFVESYPDVKPTDIPAEVWKDVEHTQDLVASYAKYERSKLKEEIETLKNNAKNSARSTGSMKSSGSGKIESEYDRMWYDDDY